MFRTVRAHAPAWSLVAAAASWALATVISKRAVDEIEPLTLLPIELAVSVVMLGAAAAMTGQRVRRSSELSRLALLGVLNPGVSYALGLVGLARITASMSVLLWAVEPLLILAFAWLLLRQQPTARLMAWSLLALVGVVLVVFVPSGAGEPLGVAFTLAGVSACAIYTVLSSYVLVEVSSLTVVLVQQVAAFLFALVLFAGALIVGQGGSLSNVSLTGWASAVIAGVLYYAVAFWFYINGLRHVRPAVAGMFLNLIPLFGLAASRVLLDERLSGRQWVGAALIVAAVLAIARGQARGPTEPERVQASARPGETLGVSDGHVASS
jgi:probable blue pigment (indigoidine) exporter